jgi:hypothetical protein
MQEQATTNARTSNDKCKNKQQQRPMQGFFTSFRMTAFTPEGNSSSCGPSRFQRKSHAGIEEEQATTKARTSNCKGKNKQRQRPMQGFFTSFRMTASMPEGGQL